MGPQMPPGRRLATCLLALLMALSFIGCQTNGDNTALKDQPILDVERDMASAQAPVLDQSTAGGSNKDPTAGIGGSTENPEPLAPEDSLTGTANPPDPAGLEIIYDFRPALAHGYKGPEHQRYIMLHDTESTASPRSVIDYWDGTGSYVAAHFVVGRDGSVYQCVPLDQIAHHAGFAPAGYNGRFGVADESRDDRRGTAYVAGRPDYGMNSHSIGIELVHSGGGYPAAQLEALDRLIAYIDACYGGWGGEVIDHKAWAVGNSDTSPEFAGYLQSYQERRSHR